MTDKIIIDGIDVSECENHTNCGVCCIAHISFGSCKNNPNCYYKQLKRKEQECERLRKQYNCNACGTCIGKEDYKNMQRHCKKAIAQNHKYKQALKNIELIVRDYCKTMCLAETKETCDDCVDNEILDIINKVKEELCQKKSMLKQKS